MNQSNMPAQQQQRQPFTQDQGMDSHTSTEDSFSKSTQEHHSQQQPAFNTISNVEPQTGQNKEEDFSTSTQENKSHKSSSHITPCTTAGGARAGEPMGQNLNTANTAQPLDSSSFGGNAAAGGSSSLNMGSDMGVPQNIQGKAPAQAPGQGQGQGEYMTPHQKYSADADRPVQQQQHVTRDQRGGF